MRLRVACLVLLGSLLARPAFADLTAFVGVNPTPETHLVRGVAGGIALVVVGFEFEYADAAEDVERGSPSLRTGMGNFFVQTPFPVSGMQFYATTGAGLYRERLVARQETHVGVNIGGGVKITLAGPLRLRLDYRVFTLRGDPLYARPQRFYAGLNLKF
jgi:hypothetical protein